MKASQIFSIFLRIKLRKTGKTQRNFNQCPDLGSTKITIRNQEKVYVKTLIFQKKSFEKFFKFNSISEENLNSTGNDGNLLEFGKSKPKKNPEFEVWMNFYFPAGLPNLFSENFAQLKGEIEKNQNCTEAFQVDVNLSLTWFWLLNHKPRVWHFQ